jgi:hypothetical protein
LGSGPKLWQLTWPNEKFESRLEVFQPVGGVATGHEDESAQGCANFIARNSRAKIVALYWDIGNIVPMKQTGKTKTIERVQIGARIEKTLVKTLKALAEYLDLSLGDLLEGITLHALEGRSPFSKKTLSHIRKMRAIYGLDLTARDSHRLVENDRDHN